MPVNLAGIDKSPLIVHYAEGAEVADVVPKGTDSQRYFQ